MLRAIEHVLERDNHVLAAGDACSQLFFCWAGYGFAPEAPRIELLEEIAEGDVVPDA